MTTKSSYEPGSPCWIDLTSPDVDASKAFYGSLFGWESTDEYDDGNWIYSQLTKDGQVVAGLGAQQPEMAGMPPMWNTYVATDDIDAVLGAVEAAGGTVMMPAMDVMDEGRMAVLADPAGAVVCLWQAGNHIGAELVNEPDTWAWNELLTRDLDTALAFHGDVFGWEFQAMEMPTGTYHVVAGGEDGGLAGMMGMPDGFPDQVPNHWVVYFLVADAEATLARAVELGGSVTHGPDPSGVGILAGVHDPQGGSFSIMQPLPADDAG